VRHDLRIELLQPRGEFLALLLRRGDALLDRAAFFRLRGQPAAGPLRLNFLFGKLLAVSGQLLLDLVAGELPALVPLFLLGDLLAQGFQLGRGDSQVDGGLSGVTLQQAILTRENHACRLSEFTWRVTSSRMS